ncbi:transcriptional regulator, TetR family [Chitinophaga sp. YR573]|uniref:TetR/AcrR family transcriptional regulator n=1 Tax=Chitinophaga sp. YR573 TaxID=1881040 RepID=UPI0008C0AA87|nr:TetR/AcrR family transcriptional regulator [Chitinophaga sp. YR573]SEW10123.1 transcriptional regulator, TetR family [Chitinophaga sp. YR573]
MHAETKDEMREKILEATLKRFTHYGASKTTMNEIADDLRCSKASLYYYFPDKKGLHFAVLEKIGEIFHAEQEAEAQNMTSATQTLLNIIEIKRQFVQRYSRLELFKVLNDGSPETQRVMREMKIAIDALITKIMKYGVETGEFVIDDVERMAELYNQTMEGLRFSVIDYCMPVQINADLAPEDFERIVAQQKLLTEIFVKGLKHR